MRRSGSWLAVIAASGLANAQTTAPAPAAAAATNIPYVDAKPILATIRPELLPPGLQAKTAADVEVGWAGWVSERDAQIRARLASGDRDSITNLLLFGVTFTDQPRMSAREMLLLASRGTAAEIASGPVVQRRLDDMVAAIASPGTDERLGFVRGMVEAAGINPGTPEGRQQLRRYLEEGLQPVLAEYEAYSRAAVPDQSVRFGDRGLSSDTSVLPGFAIEQALEGIAAAGLLAAGSVRRVGIAGPGLDFADKREGYDFYPQQTLQPFALIDSLVRLGLATRDNVRISTFDLSPRVNQHLEAAVQRARAGSGYVLQLPRAQESGWAPQLDAYWQRFGNSVGETVTPPVQPPAGLPGVEVRAVRIPAAVVLSIAPHDVNIVLQRLEPLAASERFDMIIATNLLVYYDVFERSLALVNIEKMLRPGGFLLANNSTPVILPDSMDSVGFSDTVFSGRVNDRDRIYWYRKK